MFVVLAGMESRSNKTVLIPDGRTDIPILVIEIFLRQGVHDPHAIIECKRLAGSDAHFCREYVVEGVDRFRTGKYGADHVIDFMVGYLIAGTTVESADGINTFLTRTGREPEHPRTLEFSVGTFCWASAHLRAKGSGIIELRHTFLRCK